jgi:DNA anti-recombination protein RmuC
MAEGDLTIEQRAEELLTRIETLTDAFLEHLTSFDDRLDRTMQQVEETMNARIEARVQEELTKRGIDPAT